MKKEDIIKLRKHLGLSQERFAQEIGANTVSINRWELGKVKPSRLYMIEIKKLGEKHGIEIS